MRHIWSGVAASVCAAAGLAAACTVANTPSPWPSGTVCTELAHLRIDSIAWKSDGTELAVVALDRRSGDGVVVLLQPPTFGESAELRRSSNVLSLNGIASSATGYAWVEQTANGFDVVASAGAARNVLGHIDSPVFNLRYQGSSLLAIDERLGSQIVRLDVRGAALGSQPVTNVDGVVESFDVDADGRIVYAQSHGPGTSLTFVVIDGGTVRTLSPSGHLIGNPTFGADDGEVYFEDHDDGVLRAMSIKDGTERVILRSDVSSVAVSQVDGAIAHTFILPDELAWLCVDPAPPPLT